jgi:hypothetical protein
MTTRKAKAQQIPFGDDNKNDKDKDEGNGEAGWLFVT